MYMYMYMYSYNVLIHVFLESGRSARAAQLLIRQPMTTVGACRGLSRHGQSGGGGQGPGAFVM